VETSARHAPDELPLLHSRANLKSNKHWSVFDRNLCCAAETKFSARFPESAKCFRKQKVQTHGLRLFGLNWTYRYESWLLLRHDEYKNNFDA
jgi:hypothetical protein